MTDSLQSLINEIKNATHYISTNEPLEIKKLYAGILPYNAGASGQYFGTMVFATSELRALSILYLGTSIIRTLEDDDFSLDQCRKQIRFSNLYNGMRYLGYSGFNQLWSFTKEIFTLLDDIATKIELKDLMTAYFNYVWILYEWSLQRFPWALGTGVFRKRSKAKMTELANMYLDYSSNER
jgi:hypothetical protein